MGGQVKQDVDRKIAEKEDEFNNTRKNHARAMDSMQASLESEQAAKAEALRIKKKLEGEINELEIALDHANKANNEALKSTKRYQAQLKEAECLNEEASRVRQEMAEKASLADRRGIFHNKDKTFLTWVNEEDQLRIISMQSGGDVRAVFDRLARGIKAVGDSVKAESGKEFMLDPKYGYVHSCPTNLGTGMRASVHIDLPGWTKLGPKVLAARCEELQLQPRGTRGESGGQTGVTYDISNKHRLGYSGVQLVQKMIDGVSTLVTEARELQKKHGI